MRYEKLTSTEQENLKTLYRTYGVDFVKEYEGDVIFKLRDDVDTIHTIFGDIKNINFKEKSFRVGITGDFLERIRYVIKVNKENMR